MAGRVELTETTRFFHVSGIANTQEVCIWGTENPRALQYHEIRGEKFTPWRAINSKSVLDAN